MPYITDWEARANDLAEQIARNDTGAPLIVSMVAGADEYVSIVFPANADLSDIETTLWQLRAYSEASDVDVSDDKLPAAHEVEGLRVQQRVADLDPGRVYIWRVMHGESGNRSADVLMIKCPELGEM